jgi:hypothetical protein
MDVMGFTELQSSGQQSKIEERHKNRIGIVRRISAELLTLSEERVFAFMQEVGIGPIFVKILELNDTQSSFVLILNIVMTINCPYLI